MNAVRKMGLIITIDEKVGRHTYRTVYHLDPQEDFTIKGTYVVMRLFRENGELKNELRDYGKIRSVKSIDFRSESEKKPRKILNIKIEPVQIL